MSLGSLKSSNQQQFEQVDQRLTSTLKRGSAAALSRRSLTPSLLSRGNHNGHSKIAWDPNEGAENCTLCKSKFSILKRKHHCRKCGVLVCGSCSGNSWYAPGYTDAKVRICDTCYKQWMAFKVSSHNINKTSVFSSYFNTGVAGSNAH
ncbi:hypothetical protein FGO68_gene318 [Halteria grandinella]|uniref:FYVE-type domain-containing protein n=1 Tax=Halteria grandinella TaxID=5974 RepID=A0A8J8T692_HALGN|nr:hypothetical protein FGO68_gene318 [Halteria grandinella]